MIEKIRRTLTVKYTLIIAFILITGFLSSYAAYRSNGIRLLHNSLFDYLETEVWEAEEMIRNGSGDLGTRKINVDIRALHSFTYWLVNKKVVRAETLADEAVADRLQQRLTEKYYHPGKIYHINIKHDKQKWYFLAAKQDVHLPSDQMAEIFVIANYTPIRTNTKAYLLVVAAAVLLILVLAYLTSNFLTARSMQYIEQSYLKQRQFTSDAAHEFRTPLTILHSYAELLEYKPDKKEIIRNIKDEIQQMNDMIDRLLEIARYDSESKSGHFRRFSLSKLTAAAVSSAAALCPSGVFTTNADKTEIEINGDEVMIRQLLRILLDNAVKFTPREKRISVSLQPLSRSVQINISDNGIGIKKEDIGRIFDRFWRAEESRHKKGLGLGLSLAKIIVEHHDGSISAESEPSKGTTFRVVLPLR